MPYSYLNSGFRFNFLNTKRIIMMVMDVAMKVSMMLKFVFRGELDYILGISPYTVNSSHLYILAGVRMFRACTLLPP